MKRVSIVLLLAALGGCNFLPPKPWPPNASAQDRAELPSFWRLDGRIGVQLKSDAWQANLFWDHDPNQDRLRISGPLSQGMVSIIVQKDLIYINEGEGVTELSRDPERALQDRLGFSVPLQSLRYWVLGIPDPSVDNAPLAGPAGDAGGFSQSGWFIRALSSTTIGGRTVPEKISIQKPGVKLKLVADHWEMGGSP